MLNPFQTMFRNADSVQSTSLLAGGLSFMILAFNAAGQLHTGLLGLLSLLGLFLLLGWVACYWYAASVHFLTQVLAVEQRHSQPWLTSLQGVWPLILLGPAVSAQRWWPSFGILFALGILIGTGVNLVLSLRRAYNIGWLQSSFCLGITVILGGLALLGVLGWPMMLVLGAKHFSILPIF